MDRLMITEDAISAAIHNESLRNNVFIGFLIFILFCVSIYAAGLTGFVLGTQTASRAYLAMPIEMFGMIKEQEEEKNAKLHPG